MAVTFTLAYAPSIIVIAVENIWPSKIDFYDSENYSAQFSMNLIFWTEILWAFNDLYLINHIENLTQADADRAYKVLTFFNGVFIYSNSLINGIIYIYRSPQFR